MSVFLPDRLELVKGPPAAAPRAPRPAGGGPVAAARGRRAGEYSRVLAQRNALLGRHPRRARLARHAGRLGPRAGASPALRVREHRARAVDAAGRAVRRARRRSSGCSGEVSLEYRPRSRAADEEEFVAELARAPRPATSSAASPATGPTATSSPILRDGRELRVYGSQGEQRLALLALLLAERAVLAERARPHPADAARRRHERARRRAPRAARRRAARRAGRA